MSYFYVKVINSQIFLNQAMTGDVNSDVVQITNSPTTQAIFSYSIQAIWSSGSSLAGVLKIQASNDDTNYVDITGTEQGVTGASGTIMWNISGHSYKSIRLAWDNSAGTGTLNAYYRGLSYQV